MIFFSALAVKVAQPLRKYGHVLLPPVGVALLLGLTLRLWLSFDPGYGFDVGVNQGWALSAVQLGLARSYVEQVNGNMLPNYPPFSMMIFACVGYAYKFLISSDFDTTLIAYVSFIKLPGIIADVLTIAVLSTVVRTWKGKQAGRLAALVYALHPASMYDSAIWGQTDAIFTLFLVTALWLRTQRQPALSAMSGTLSLLTKTQAIMLYPLFAILYTTDVKTFFRSILTGMLTIACVLLPFALGGVLLEVYHSYTHSVGYYPLITFGAYNFWWGLFADAAGSKNDTDLLFGLLTYRLAGLILFFSAYIVALWSSWRQLRANVPPAHILFSVSAFIAHAFFVLNTEMHERYLFAYIALGLPMAFISRKHAWVYAGVSFLFLWNLLGVLPYGNVDRAFFNEFPTLDVGIAWAQVVLLIIQLYWILQLRRLPAPKKPANTPAVRPNKLLKWITAKIFRSLPPKTATRS